jgi:hypothetical protein
VSASLWLPRTARRGGAPDLKDVLKAELQAQDPAALPLQQALAHGSHALGEGFSVTVLDVREEGDLLLGRVGVFFQGIVAGCGCADDPTPVEPYPEYCELTLEIDRTTGRTRVRLNEQEGSR